MKLQRKLSSLFHFPSPLRGGKVRGMSLLLALCCLLGSLALPSRAVDGTAQDIEATFAGSGLRFADILQDIQAASPGTVDYITDLQVSTEQGTLYDGYVSEGDTGAGVSHHQHYFLSGNGLYLVTNLTFVPKPEFGGTAEVSYTAHTTSGLTYGGTIRVSVDQQASLMSYFSPNGEAIHFEAHDFSLYCSLITHRELRYITFTLPSSSYGTLYYQYQSPEFYGSPVDATSRYYPSSSPNLDDIAFVPRRGYSGDFYINFTMCDVSGNLTKGRCAMRVELGNTVGGLLYQVEPGGRVNFEPADFSTASVERTGYGVNYIRFRALPLPSQGTLNCTGRSGVSTSDNFYATGDRGKIGDLSFTASTTYTGTLSIPITLTNSDNTTLSLDIQIEVASRTSASFQYSVTSGQRIFFRIPELYTACMERTGYPLDSLRFTSLPPESAGVLYFQDDKKITSGSSYYYSGNTNLLEQVSFLAADTGSSTVAIPFIITSTAGQSFSGSFIIELRDDGSSKLSYVVYSGQQLLLSATDLNALCYRKLGEELRTIRFSSLPDASQGQVYYEDISTRANTANFYYYVRSGNNRVIDELFFAPGSSYSGLVTIPFVCRGAGGGSFNGLLEITVVGSTSGRSSAGISYETSGAAVRFRGEDFTSAAAILLSSELKTVRFTNPDPGVGTLYTQYISPPQSTPLKSGADLTPAQCNSVYFVPKALTRGEARVGYTITDASGNSASGFVIITVQIPNVSSYFDDMGAYSWATCSVDFLRSYDIVSGVGERSYGPGQPMRRGDYILMLTRCFPLPQAGSESFADVPQDKYYAAAIAAAKSAGIVTGTASENFYPEATITRRDAAVYLYRCLTHSGIVVAGGEDDLAPFSDRNLIPSYAVPAMGALVRRGIMVGDGQGHLNPSAPLNRAELAVILHKGVA